VLPTPSPHEGFFLGGRERFWRVTTGFFHFQQFVAIPRPALASSDQLVPLTAGEVQGSTSDTPTGDISIVLFKGGPFEVSPGQDLQNFIVRLAKQPRTDAGFVIDVGECDAPSTAKHMASDLVPPLSRVLAAHSGRVANTRRSLFTGRY